jgi:hypothetical protein
MRRERRDDFDVLKQANGAQFSEKLHYFLKIDLYS